MTYSPSPSSPTAGTGSGLHLTQRSPTPPQPISKRDKRRNQHIAYQQDLENEFNQNRDHHFRAQLLSLQYDMNAITQADPYNPEPLEDSPDEIARMMSDAAVGTPYFSEVSSLAGKYYQEFVHEVNDAKEARDLALIQLQADHDARLSRLKYECEYRMHLAAEEYNHLQSTMRERLAQTLSNKRQRLMKEKEHLDIADTNTLLLHPAAFSITNPASPGSGATSRKTRHNRHKAADADELGNGLAPTNLNKKRHRHLEDDVGSPARNGDYHLYRASTPAERSRQRTILNQTAPLYSLSNLFTEKELNFQTHQAHIATRHFFSASHKNSNGDNANGTLKKDRGSSSQNGDASPSSSKSGSDSEPEEGSTTGGNGVGAADMDRTASQQNFHVTRSTRGVAGLAGLNILSDLAEKAATRPSVPYATLYNHQPKAGMFLPPLGKLMPEELDEDLLREMDNERKEKGEIDQELIEDALEPLEGGHSTLAPDWPAFLDVHLVDKDSRVPVA